MKRNALYGLLTLAVLALIVGPIGIAAFVLGFGLGDSPCVLCWAQRTGMLIIALLGLFVIRFGPRPRYIGMAVLVGGAGIYMGLRQSSLHVWRDVGQGFSAEILGAHTYTWSMFIYWVCVAMMGALLLLLKDGEAAAVSRPIGTLERVTLWLFLVVAGGNAVQAFASTGPPPFMGQSDPVRFSFNPRHWVWSIEEWKSSPISWRGRWAIEKPDVARAPADPAASPLSGVPVLAAGSQRRLALPLSGSISDLAYDASTDRFLLTTQRGVYITDSSLGRVVRHTEIDAGFSVDLARFSAAAFLDSATVIAVAENKSYVILRQDDTVNANANFRYFTESFGQFSEVTRSRFTTVRAKMMYVMSMAFDPASASVYTITVPNAKGKRFVVSRFDRRDMTLSEEFTPALAPGSGLTFKDKDGSLDAFFVTAATFSAGRIYAFSAAASTLLTIDPIAHTVVAAHVIPGILWPAGIAIRGRQLYLVSDSGALSIVDLPPTVAP